MKTNPLVGDETAKVRQIEATGDHVYVAGCGQRFNGTIVACGSDDFAMAYFDRRTKAFYFAVRSIGFSPSHVEAKLTTYPAIAGWNGSAQGHLAAWTKIYNSYERGTTLP